MALGGFEKPADGRSRIPGVPWLDHVCQNRLPFVVGHAWFSCVAGGHGDISVIGIDQKQYGPRPLLRRFKFMEWTGIEKPEAEKREGGFHRKPDHANAPLELGEPFHQLVPRALDFPQLPFFQRAHCI